MGLERAQEEPQTAKIEMLTIIISGSGSVVRCQEIILVILKNLWLPATIYILETKYIRNKINHGLGSDPRK